MTALPLCPQIRAVAEDEAGGRGFLLSRWQWALGLRANADAYADADANADANAYAYADADADANADADADANAYAYAYAYAIKESNMRNGLYAVSLWSGDLMVVRVGWFQRSGGDDWRVWWTTPYRGEYTTKLSDVWAEGPSTAKAWRWGPLLESDVTRFHFVPLARLDPAKWEKVAPRPKEYAE